MVEAWDAVVVEAWVAEALQKVIVPRLRRHGHSGFEHEKEDQPSSSCAE